MRGAVAGDARRHRRRHADRRPAQARGALRRTTSTSDDLRRRRRRRGRARPCVAFHEAQGKLATVTAVQPPGTLRRAGPRATTTRPCARFTEKPQGDGGWINGGFFVLEPAVLDYIDGDATLWEQEPLERLAARRRSSPPTGTRGSGSRWTHCATSARSRAVGRRGARPGRPGDVRRRLCGPARVRHRPHRLQGFVAGVVARRSRRRGDRVCARPADGAESLRGARAGRSSCATSSRTCAMRDRLADELRAARPEVVFHLAAQPLVRARLRPSRTTTFETNVMGTVNVLEAVRACDSVAATSSSRATSATTIARTAARSAEDDAMGGHDPYSASKGCAELVAAAYRASFFGCRRLRPSPPLAPATSSAAATGRRIGSCRTACAR